MSLAKDSMGKKKQSVAELSRKKQEKADKSRQKQTKADKSGQKLKILNHRGHREHGGKDQKK
tara:strand:+ start:911 stop:1096 length:186 start_codon:yes stop_codon:yes gene_type:complete